MESFLNDRVILHPGDCLEVLARLEENSIDACVTDPPYHLQSIVKRFAKTGRTDKTRTSSGPHQRTVNGFMNKVWDGGDIAFRTDTWECVYRVLKPGAYIVAFSSTRTFGRMSVALDDAGFITHPFVAWIFGQGFPKAHRIEADEWEGWHYGTQSLKPAIEPIYVGQKPFEKGLTGTENVLKWGTGAINVDGCRVETTESLNGGAYAKTGSDRDSYEDWRFKRKGDAGEYKQPPGRWPANVIHDGSEEVVGAFPAKAGAFAPVRGHEPSNIVNNVYGARNRPGGVFHDDSGSAARFFYTAKADGDDRLGSKHPTVKPLDLMQYLVRLVTPPRGTVLDPFAGTGTTGEAAWREGMRAMLIEAEPEYQSDIRRRMALALAGPDERMREAIKARGLTESPGPLFDSAAHLPEAAE